MATSAESAQAWVNEKSPSNEEIQSVIEKLEKRIDGWQGDEDSIQGSIDAVDFLSAKLEQANPITDETQPPLTEQLDASALSTEPSTNLDSSNLIPDCQPVELEQSVKRATFEALKQQLNKEL